eukprot:1227063-Pleurochrysis_carterae.AAC.1
MPMSLASAASAGTNFHSSGYRNMAIVPQSTTVPMACAVAARRSAAAGKDTRTAWRIQNEMAACVRADSQKLSLR